MKTKIILLAFLIAVSSKAQVKVGNHVKIGSGGGGGGGNVTGSFTTGVYPVGVGATTLADGTINWGVTTTKVLTITTPIVVGGGAIEITPSSSSVSSIVQIDGLAPGVPSGDSDSQVAVGNGQVSLSVTNNTGGTITEDSSGNIVHTFVSTYNVVQGSSTVLDYNITNPSIFNFAQAPSITGLSGTSPLCANGTNNAITNIGCSGGGGGLSGMTTGQVPIAATASTVTSSKAIQGTDTKLLSSGTVSGTSVLLCTDANGGATTSSCPSGNGLSGMTASQVAIAATASTVTSSKAIQGSDTNILSSGTVSGTGATLCTDAGGGATTTGCTTGGSLSGMTTGQIPVAATATTVTSSKAIAGAGAGITTGPTSSTNNDLVSFSGTSGQVQDAGALTGSAPIVVTGTTVSCPTCGVSSGGTNVSQNSGSTEANLAVTGFMPQVCSDSSGSGTAQTCSTSNTFTPQSANCVVYKTTTTNSGAGLTVNINSLGAKSVAIPGISGWTTTLVASIVPANKPLLVCYDGTNWNVQQTGTPPSSLSGMTATQVAIAASATTVTSSKAIQGSDTSLLSSGTVSGTSVTLCTDANGGATTTGCVIPLSGLTTGQIPVAATATTATSSKALQGTDTSILTSGTVSGTSVSLCTDANGGATTSSCTNGISGMTTGQVAIAGSATTVTSSKVLAGVGAGITTGPTSSTSGDIVTYTGTGGQTSDSGTLLSSLAPKASPTFTGTVTTPITGSTQCVHVNSSGVISGVGFDCTPSISNIQITTNTTTLLANTCNSNTATTMTGVATTSVFMVTPTTDTAAVTGWGSTGGLILKAYPTLNTINWAVCNQTTGSITPGSSVTWNVGAK